MPLEGVHLLPVLAFQFIPHVYEPLLDDVELLCLLLEQSLSLGGVLLLQVLHFLLVLLDQQLQLHYQFLFALVVVLCLNRFLGLLDLLFKCFGILVCAVTA